MPRIPLAAIPALLLLAGCVNRPDTAPAAVTVPAAPALPADQAFPIVAPGLRTALIVADDPADLHAPNTNYVFPYVGGALHLKRHLDWIAGTNLPVLPAKTFTEQNTRQPFDVRIWIGTQPKVREALGKELESLDDDGFLIRASGSDLYLAGRTVWATEYAVYDLLEKAAGCGFYAPGPNIWNPASQWEPGLFNSVPRSPVVAISKGLSIREDPDYKNRFMRHTPPAAFRSRNRDRYHHNLIAPFIPHTVQTNTAVYAAWTKEHADWFPEIRGVRTPPPTDRLYDFQPCIGNPEVTERIVAAARQAFTAGGQSCYSIGMNDSGRYCQCARCAALVPPQWQGRLNEGQTNAMAFFIFYNTLAERLAPEFPGKRLGCLAYAALSTLPEGAVSLHPMIVPYLTRDSAQLFDAQEVREFKETVDKWSRLAARMGIYEYTYGGGFLIPRLYNRYILANIKARYGVGVDGFYAEDYPNWGLDGVKYWLIMKTLWNTKADPRALQADYCRDLYGPAARAMRDWYDELEETWCTQEARGMVSTRSNYRWLNDVRQLGIFPPDRCDRAQALLDRAERELQAAAGGSSNEAERAYCDQALRRVRFHRDAFAVTRTLGTLYALGRELEPMATNAAPLDYAASLEKLDTAFRLPGLRDIYNTMRDLNEPNLPAFNATFVAGSFSSFAYHFGRFPGLARTIRRIASETVDEALKAAPADPAALRAAVAAILHARCGAVATGKPEAVERLASLAADTGALMIRAAAAEPVVDGVIKAEEWGEPAFDGRFFLAHTLDPASERTTIWARHKAGRLYFAFRCEQPTNTIACAVQGVRTDAKHPYRMAQDDAVSISMFRPGAPFRGLRFNAAGAWSDNVADPAQPQPYTLKTRITETGWEAELAFDEKGSLISRDFAAQAPAAFCVARYAHGIEGVYASTLAPVADVGGHIGSGNHESLMTFVWGPRVVYR